MGWDVYKSSVIAMHHHYTNMNVPSVSQGAIDGRVVPHSVLTRHSIHQHLQCLLINVTSSITYSTNLPWTSAMYKTESQSIEIQAGYLPVVKEIRWEPECSWMLLNVDSYQWIRIQIQLLLTKVIVLSLKKASTYASAYSIFFISELE